MDRSYETLKKIRLTYDTLSLIISEANFLWFFSRIFLIEKYHIYLYLPTEYKLVSVVILGLFRVVIRMSCNLSELIDIKYGLSRREGIKLTGRITQRRGTAFTHRIFVLYSISEDSILIDLTPDEIRFFPIFNKYMVIYQYIDEFHGLRC
jgi:hypothetical protein